MVEWITLFYLFIPNLYGIKGFLNKPIEKRVLIQKALKTDTGSIRL